MKTVKQTVDIAFKYAEIKDVINLLPLMDLLAQEFEYINACFPSIPTVQIYKIFKTLKRMGFEPSFEPIYSKEFVISIAEHFNMEIEVIDHIEKIEKDGNIPNYENILKDLIPDE